MTKKQPPPESASRGPMRLGQPECAACGFAGWPTAEATPYKACGGDQARHQRTPVGTR